jgi:hypothetical protein
MQGPAGHATAAPLRRRGWCAGCTLGCRSTAQVETAQAPALTTPAGSGCREGSLAPHSTTPHTKHNPSCTTSRYAPHHACARHPREHTSHTAKNKASCTTSSKHNGLFPPPHAPISPSSLVYMSTESCRTVACPSSTTPTAARRRAYLHRMHRMQTRSLVIGHQRTVHGTKRSCTGAEQSRHAQGQRTQESLPHTSLPLQHTREEGVSAQRDSTACQHSTATPLE